MTSAVSPIAHEHAPIQLIARLKDEVGKTIIGQHYMVDRLILALIADGHVLLEGLPGLAKTTAVKALAQAMDTDFARIQFTPDLLPADLVGTEIYDPRSASFQTRQGPIFTNLLLTDEINRAPSKVQSALLEAMQERQVTLGHETFKLPDPFLVLATQNPIEQEGTYPLPEAQMDRFMLKLKIDYPTKEEEKAILRSQRNRERRSVQAVVKPEDILAARTFCADMYLDAKVEDYIVDIVFATRDPLNYGLHKLDGLIEHGASPRATLCLATAARVHALMEGRDFVTPQDIKTLAPDVLRHRIILSYEAEARELDSDRIIRELLNGIDVP